jgi:hypothetical protein
MRLHKALLALASVALGTGCATDAVLRTEAQALSVYVEKVKTDAEALQQARDTVAKSRVATLNYLQANALASEQSVSRESAAREVAQDKQWLTLFEALRKAPDLVATQRQARREAEAAAAAALAASKGAVDVRSAKLTEASSTLAGLAQKRSTREELSAYRDFLKVVSAELEKKSEDANALADQAAQAAKVKVEN